LGWAIGNDVAAVRNQEHLLASTSTEMTKFSGNIEKKNMSFRHSGTVDGNEAFGNTTTRRSSDAADFVETVGNVDCFDSKSSW
jgi:hypothetical protein